MRAIQIEEFGGVDVLQVQDVPVPEPGPDEALIEVTRCGVNFADTHQRENSYLSKFELPLIPGGEVAGVTEDGQRVIGLLRSGGYAEYAVAPRSMVFPIPDGVDDGHALALLIQGTTAWHLYKTCARLAEGERVLVISGAGGVGSLAVQLGKRFGGHVVATASSEEKRLLCLELGADEAISAEDIEGPFDVVLEMAGGQVFEDSLNALAPFGRLVAYGIAGREPNTVQSGALMRKSRAVVGFWLMHALDRLREPLDELFEMGLRVVVGETYPMSEVRRAHEDLQARRTSGKQLLNPAA
ncbi:MAG: NADPH:quinone oxidoreductase family protein [Thermoleophilaceae bacterium]